MKFYCLIIFTIITSPLYTQNLFSKDLKKYSYLLAAVKTGSKDSVLGTGFIISYKNQNYLVTNYHILSGRNAITSEILNPNGFPPNELTIWFHSKKNKLIPANYLLIDNLKKAIYFTLQIDYPIYIDIAILPINLPNNVSAYIIKKENFDTSSHAWPDKELTMVGFPKGKYDKNNYPFVFTTKSLIPPYPNRIHPYVYYDLNIENGTSGSPVYFLDDNNKLKLIAINSIGLDRGSTPINARGAAIYFKYVLMAINNNIRRTK